jgi:hypothetical protein
MRTRSVERIKFFAIQIDRPLSQVIVRTLSPLTICSAE